MKIILEVEVEHLEGRPQGSRVVGEYLCDQISQGEMPAEPGNIWPGNSHYRILSASVQVAPTPPRRVRKR